MLTQNLGYPRIGTQRELKKACENYWSGKIDESALLLAGKQEREKNWQAQMEANIDLIPCNDFSFYDQVQDMSFTLGCIPERFSSLSSKISGIDLYFAMCRGYQKDGFDIVAMEMTKWFDTNYHYIVPEFTKNQEFRLSSRKIFNEFLEAKRLGVKIPKPVLIGPVSYLLLGKEKDSAFSKLDLIDQILPVYIEILTELKKLGCAYVQLDEPFLVTELNQGAKAIYKSAYEKLQEQCPELKIILATYFDSLDENTSLAVNLPVHALHVDLVKAPEQLDQVLNVIPQGLTLSLGLVDGRNIWKNKYETSLKAVHQTIDKIGKDRVWIAPSCSLLHCPYDLELETNEESLPEYIKEWMAFSKQKLGEINTLRKLKSRNIHQYDDNFTELIENSRLHAAKITSGAFNSREVQKDVESLLSNPICRNSTFENRIQKQNKKLKLGLFPTTTIGSFPQTNEIRKMRRSFKNNVISQSEYETFLKKEIEKTIRIQEEVGLDVLVHGEYERNDMVEYFGQYLEGFAFTENGWVQSYGSRGVKPPVIFGDVYRKSPITVQWSEYAQSLTQKKVKGMLTGPVTILQWSFVRNDQPREATCYQIASALRHEVLELEKAGIEIIQIDEPALREGLPLKKKNWDKYLNWAVKAFRICSFGVSDETQIHTHMCYSDFNDIIESIAQMDADVISIETSRSHMELLKVFKDFKYPNQIGPGVYDIHSPRVPGEEEIERLLLEAEKYIPIRNIWINPDCGLKTRNWEEVRPALENMVKAASHLKTLIEATLV